VDLGPADGDTRVFPIAPGTVVCSGWNGGVGPGCDLEPPDPQPGKGLGWFVVLEHRLPRGDSHRRVYSVYGHLASRPLYSSGEEVTSVDEPLGFMGDTGGASAPHLHLEIQDGDRWEDFTFGDTEHGFSYAPPAQVLTDPWYERYLDPVDFIERRSVWRQ
jgi:murein DD-endopeptidase MepM/ murein hydrolase activator NlpD